MSDHKPGPLVWGPLSEVYGRTRPLFIGFAIFAGFQIPIAVAGNIETIMIYRFLAGSLVQPQSPSSAEHMWISGRPSIEVSLQQPSQAPLS
jgi:MFS family permease